MYKNNIDRNIGLFMNKFYKNNQLKFFKFSGVKPISFGDTDE